MSFIAEIAVPADAEALAELHYLSHTVSFAAFASSEWLETRDIDEYAAQWHEFFRHARNDESACAWKVSANGTVVGMVKVGPMSDSEAQLSSMHVHPDYQRRGIGSLLMNSAIEFIREAGFSRATLGVIQANAPARAIYERHGWTAQELSENGVEGVPVAVYGIEIKKHGRE